MASIVIVNSRFLERPQKRSRGNQLIHSCLTRTRGVHASFEAMIHFPRVSDFPRFRKEFSRLEESFPNFRFSSADDLFKSSTTNFEISPYFGCFITFPPISQKLLFSL